MKRIVSFINIAAITVLLAFMFTACAANSSGDTHYRELLSNTQEEVFKSLNIAKEDANMTGNNLFLLPNKEKYLGYDFSVSLLFDQSDILYGYMYSMEYSDKTEKAVDALEDIVSKLTKENGEPDTYPEHPDKLSSAKKPIEVLSSGEFSKLFENWNLEETDNLVLEAVAQRMSESNLTISIKYQIQMPPQ